MAESFTNAFARGVGIVTTSPNGSIGIGSTNITGIGTTGVNIGDLVDTQNFLGGTKVVDIKVDEVVLDRNSLNNSATSSQSVSILGVTTVYTSPAGVKSILIGGTLSNNSSNQVAATVQVSSGSTSYSLVYDVPIPAGSSFVISDAGKTTLLSGEELRIFCNTENAIDATISILQGVS